MNFGKRIPISEISLGRVEADSAQGNAANCIEQSPNLIKRIRLSGDPGYWVKPLEIENEL